MNFLITDVMSRSVTDRITYTAVLSRSAQNATQVQSMGLAFKNVFFRITVLN